MNYFYLIRHAQKQNLKGDPDLSELGIKQVHFTTDYLRKFPIKSIYSSSLLRAKQTAEYIAKSFNLKVIIEKNLNERINWGDDPELSFEEFLKLWERTSLDRKFKPKVGDSSYKAGERLRDVIENISKENDNSHIVLVTHGGIIVDFLRNIFSEGLLRKFKSDFFEEREKLIKECSITIVKKNRSNFFLEELASIDHLPFLIE
ncbi:histidine phosphatase family protein [Candidatus Roizmanbacteria bacterium]|nr:histidine phosphatase family protein [Candidatus Roizmanbacteria bacterium]